MLPVPARPLVVIPALDEERAVGDVVASIRATCPAATVLVVDDGSSDATASVASRAGALVASHAVNLGVGAAMRTGFLYAVRHDHDAVVQVDGDGQHDPAQVSVLLDALSRCDVVVGSRFGPGFTYPIGFARRLAIRMLSRAVSIHCRTRVSDATSGFRAAGPRATRLFARHYPTEYLGDTVESLILAGRAGLTVSEVHIQMNSRQSGNPSQSAVKGTLHLLRSAFVALQSFIRRPPPDVSRLIGKNR